MPPIKLPRLPVNWKDQPELFERYWDDATSSIETTLNAILQIPEIQAALVDLDAATAAAQAAADNANNAANGAKSEASLINSYIANFTPPLISVDAAGNVTIAMHDRIYGDPVLNPTVSVDGDTFATGAVATNVIRVYYVDALREGGAVAYQFTIDPAAPPVQGGNTHSVGAGEVPGAGSQDGNYVKPPGFVEP